MGCTTLALAGVTGGAGTTRTTVEVAATLARAGRSVAVVDAAFATQGLATHVEGRLSADVTAVVTGEAVLNEALYDAGFDVPGRVAFCPAHAPFERLARAKTPEHARAFETVVADAATRFDHVLLDVPPVAANQSVAALTTAQRRALVVPATQRGRDLLPRQQGRCRDLDAPADAVVATRTDADRALAVEAADYEVPAADPTAPVPTALDPDSALAPAVTVAAEGLLDVALDLEFPDEGLLERVGR
ncbi:AAA family ATPase [Halomicroarcula sp. F13]|uniref:AAA family ATPase n=1 Tax=Haloarcula rubra TaxID=2487747 RepID=A0AAW4PQ97_9EURY|nr:AAA family ATPase [Halomicroarcula rubra]MBX0322588.1 AAA family ATPase [Halomicroarcula rubra]